jgi:aminoglycoside phosphotransferase (APT) family kinase protein
VSTRTDPGTVDFDQRRLADWLADVTGTTAEIEVRPIRGGGSCEMFRVDRLGESWVLRRAPLALVSDTAHQVVREARIIQALAASDVPVPTVLAIGEDETVVGAPCFVMSYVDGAVVRRAGLPGGYVAHPETQPLIGAQLVDTLVSLHAFDWRSSTLVDLLRPGSYLERQVERWLTQLETYRSRELPGLEPVADWLAANLPSAGDLTVMHGDYKIDNIIWSHTAPPRVLSVLDFEMTTIGDPLVDLAWALIFWPEEGNLISLAAPGSPGGMNADYCQRPEELVLRYRLATGRDVSAFDWYQAFSAWKLAIVLEASYAAFVRGESQNPTHEFFGFVVDQLLVRARRFAG